jgi:hypothetical protein
LRSDPWEEFSSHRHVPARPRNCPAARPRRVLAGGEGPVGHDQQGVGNKLDKAGLDRQRWNSADSEEGRRPWQRAAVPGEGPANRRV